MAKRTPPGTSPKVDADRYPKIIRSGLASVKIYRWKQTQVDKTGKKRVYWAYRVPSIEKGKSPFTTTDREEAHRVARDTAVKLELGHVESRTLTGNELETYKKAEKLLQEEKLSLEAAIRDYVEGYRLVKPLTFVQIARQFKDNASRPIDPKTIEVLINEFLATRAKKSDRHKQTLTNDLSRFSDRFSGRLIDVNASDIGDWLDGLMITDRNGEIKLPATPVGERTRRNIYGSVANLFHWAQRKNCLPRERPTEIDYVEQPGKAFHVPESFSAAEMKTLLDAAPARLIPLIVLCGFAGVRRAEAERLDSVDIRRKHEDIQLWADNAKTKVRRLPPLLPNCRAWLEPYKDLKGPVCPHPDRFNQITALAKDLGLKWAHDILRDSFISNRAAILRDLPKVAYEAGNSQRVIQESYLKRVTEQEAKDFFKVYPKKNWVPIGPLI